MKITDGEKKMPIEELARKMCDSFESCDNCPAEQSCRHGQNGMIRWLRKIMGLSKE